MRSIVMASAAAALVVVGFLLGRLPIEPKVALDDSPASQPGAVGIPDLVEYSPTSPPSITEQADEAMWRMKGGSRRAISATCWKSRERTPAFGGLLTKRRRLERGR